MSVEAISWALNHAPVDEPSAAFVLVGLANHASPDGRGAFPSVARLVTYTRLSERTVREQLDILEAAGIITPCDPAIVAAYVKRADHRPQGWDLNLNLDRDNPAHLGRFQAAVKAVKDRRRQRRERKAAESKTVVTEPINDPNGVQPSHLVERGATVAPRSPRGATVADNGVRPSQERGATVAPEPYVEPSNEPSEDQKQSSLLAVGERTVRTARGAAQTPSANQGDHSRMAGDVLGQMPDHYRKAPAWLRSRMLKRIEAVLADHEPLALVEYAHKFAADPNFGDYEHLRRFDDVVRKLDADVADGTACPRCGRDQMHTFCSADVEGGTDER
ncbi:helix-turn-helix domain-containing protein [Microbispora sp. GKU 823]|uniref:helix-turn-helix domain-containing protein n=1 Tax=Microbispora sp. GKU 823 TaxID=1652100 RepID=UPI0009C6547E|nr:helix-turn-helix domain-containing protein [Microbispora sp. GKU 823]OPG09298.1 hypothetical protein B1L11_26180 [Microbispora sp. GKU 823]